ncbi:MAG: PHP domain-containing protein [Lachnospiraceae bacterium]|nr:PHP domain-containing protein [Lachnospiraceae bacterium]
MGYIDLHVHSNKSDGTLSPAEVAAHAAKQGLSAIALTDHDSVAGIAEACAAAEDLTAGGIPLRIIPGVEISADYKNRDIHILGLFVDTKNTALLKALDGALYARDKRNEKMVKNLQDAGLDIHVKDLLFDTADTVITRAHFARHLLAKGYVKTWEEAFSRYLNSNTPYYVRREYMMPDTAIRLIRASGGIPVLAHPLLYHLDANGVRELVNKLKGEGLMGIETIYSKNTGTDEAFVRKLASQFDLLMTGGSDFHGANKPDIEIGVGRGNLRIPEEMLWELEKARG